MSDQPEHDCGYDGDYRACIDGTVYGPCDFPECSGVCIPKGDCTCACHDKETRDV